MKLKSKTAIVTAPDPDRARGGASGGARHRHRCGSNEDLLGRLGQAEDGAGGAGIIVDRPSPQYLTGQVYSLCGGTVLTPN